MKLKLPDGNKIYLDTTIPLEERKKVVDEILAEWNEYFESSWELRKTQVCLEVLANYLCMEKDGEKKNKEEKFVMSATKIKHMERGSEKSANFSNLPQEHKALFGLIDYDDESGE